MGERCRGGLRLGRATARCTGHARIESQPILVLHSLVGLTEGTARGATVGVEAEGEKEDDPAKEPMTAGTL